MIRVNGIIIIYRPCLYLLFLQWKKENFDFFPMNRALCLASADDDANDAKLEEVLSKVAMIHRKQMEEVLYKKKMSFLIWKQFF